MKFNFNSSKKKAANTIISEAIEQLAGENKSLEIQKNNSLSIFKDTVTNLQNINKQLENNSLEAKRLSEQLVLQAEQTDAEIKANDRVIGKILEIFN
jgi:hypothetical protein